MAKLLSGSSILLLRHWTGQIPDLKGDKMKHSKMSFPTSVSTKTTLSYRVQKIHLSILCQSISVQETNY